VVVSLKNDDFFHLFVAPCSGGMNGWLVKEAVVNDGT
jgi:hypothetical protein